MISSFRSATSLKNILLMFGIFFVNEEWNWAVNYEDMLWLFPLFCSFVCSSTRLCISEIMPYCLYGQEKELGVQFRKCAWIHTYTWGWFHVYKITLTSILINMSWWPGDSMLGPKDVLVSFRSPGHLQESWSPSGVLALRFSCNPT